MGAVSKPSDSQKEVILLSLSGLVKMSAIIESVGQYSMLAVLVGDRFSNESILPFHMAGPAVVLLIFGKADGGLIVLIDQDWRQYRVLRINQKAT